MRPYNNNRGYNNNDYYPNNDGWGYNGPHNRGYNNNNRRGGYYPPPQQPPVEFPFEIGQKVIHEATGTELYIIGYGREQLECRKPNLDVVWCYIHELKPAPETAP